MEAAARTRERDGHCREAHLTNIPLKRLTEVLAEFLIQGKSQDQGAIQTELLQISEQAEGRHLNLRPHNQDHLVELHQKDN